MENSFKTSKHATSQLHYMKINENEDQGWHSGESARALPTNMGSITARCHKWVKDFVVLALFRGLLSGFSGFPPS